MFIYQYLAMNCEQGYKEDVEGVRLVRFILITVNNFSYTYGTHRLNTDLQVSIFFIHCV